MEEINFGFSSFL